jgi:hypothetical protein
MQMKKHIDWKRIGYTFLVCVLIPICGICGSLVSTGEIAELSPIYLPYTITGILMLSAIILVGMMIYLLISRLSYIIRFFYHNGEDKK